MSAARVVPYKGYIELLLLANSPVEQVRQAFARRGLPEPTPDLIAAYRKALWEKLTPDTKRFYESRADMFDVRSVPEDVGVNLRAAGFTEVFEKAAHLSEARRWFDSIDLRTCFTAHVLGVRDEADTLEAQSSLLKAPASPETAAVYRKYFCNSEIMTPLDWREWIIELRGYQRGEADVYATCFNNRVPFVLVKWKVNASLGKVNLDDLVEIVAQYSCLKGMELSEGLPDDCYEIAQSWMGQFMRAYQLHKTIGNGVTAGEQNRYADALFRLTQVREKPRHVTEIGDVTRTEPERKSLPGRREDPGGGD